MTMPALVTATQVAEVLGTSRTWVYDAAKDGRLPAYRIGDNVRFDPEEITRWIKAQRYR